MKFINIQTGEYPIDEYDVRKLFPNVSLPAVFSEAPEGFGIFEDVPIPEHDGTQFSVSEGQPEQVDGRWRRTWVLTPIPPAPPVVPKSSTSLEFMDRFTEAEQLAIVTATMSVPHVKLWYDRMIAATEVVYADPRVLGGLNALVGAGLLDASRVDEILPLEWR